MRLGVQWGRMPAIDVSTPEEVAVWLREAATERGEGDTPYMVNVLRGQEWISVGVGEVRSFLFASAAGWGGQPEVEALADDLWFDYNGVPTTFSPVQTRVLPEVAEAAAVEYARSGQVPGVIVFGDAFDPYAQYR